MGGGGAQVFVHSGFECHKCRERRRPGEFQFLKVVGTNVSANEVRHFSNLTANTDASRIRDIIFFFV